MRYALWVGFFTLTGCGGDAALELAASETLHTLADRMAVAITEYHEEVEDGDDARESAVTTAFVTRVVNDHTDTEELDRHTAAFTEALRKIRQDRRVEEQRRRSVMENVDVMREVAVGLEEMAIRSMTLKDEMRRYFKSWVALKRNADATMDDEEGQP